MIKKAIGGYNNSWQCPSCKKFIGLHSNEKGRCQFCEEELSFHSKTFGDEEKVQDKKVVKGKEILEPLTPEAVLEKKFIEGKLEIHTTHFTLNNNYFHDSKEATLLLPQKVEPKVVSVSFEGKPHLFYWLKKYSEDKSFSMSEVMTGFVAKGVKRYIEEKKEAQKTQ